MNIINKLENIVLNTGFSESGYVKIENLKYHQEIRKICENNSCRNYASSWACPPAIGSLEECKTRIDGFKKMLLFSKVYQLEDSFDFERMSYGLHDFKNKVDLLQKNISNTFSDFLLLSNEGCGRCVECTYPNAACRFPNLLHHSLEGYGFVVNELAEEAGIRYNNGPNTVTFFGALLLK